MTERRKSVKKILHPVFIHQLPLPYKSRSQSTSGIGILILSYVHSKIAYGIIHRQAAVLHRKIDLLRRIKVLGTGCGNDGAMNDGFPLQHGKTLGYHRTVRTVVIVHLQQIIAGNFDAGFMIWKRREKCVYSVSAW